MSRFLTRVQTTKITLVKTRLLVAIFFAYQAAHSEPNLFGNNSTFGSSSRSLSDGTPPPVPRGADGVSFVPVPMDTSLNCNSVILRGTQRFQGTAFVLPRVVVSQNKNKDTLFEIIQTGNDKYLIRFAIYFPRTNEELLVRMSKSHLLLQGCDFDAVLNALNRSVADPAQKIGSLARIPISSVDVRVDGISKAYTLGAVEASILHYQGVDHIVEFVIDSRAELDSLLARIEGSIGLGIHIAMKFNARAGDGALYANVNLVDLANSIQAGAQGRKVITTGELQAMITANLQKIGMEVQTESGSTRTFELASEQIMGWIVQSLLNSTGTNDGTYFPKTGTKDPWGSPFSTRKTNDNFETFLQKKLTSVFDPANALSDTDLVQVSAVLQLMLSKKTQKIKYENLGPSEQQVYNTSVLFRGELDDPDVRSINVPSGLENVRILPNKLKSNSKLTLSVASYTQEQISYKVAPTYFTEKQLRNQKLQNFFQLLANDKLLIRDQSLKIGVVGTMKQAPQWNPFNPDFYIWGMVEAVATTKQGTPRDIALTVDAISKLPIAVTFSRIGLRKFRLGDLLKENDYWKGEWDEMGGKILFTAKRDLGQMSIFNLEPQQNAIITQKFYFQEKRNATQILSRQRAGEEKVQLPVQRSIFKLLVTNGSDLGEVVATVTPIATGTADAGVIVPASPAIAKP